MRAQLTYEIDAAASSDEKTDLAQGRRVRKLTGLLVNVVVSGSARRFQLLTLLLNLGAHAPSDGAAWRPLAVEICDSFQKTISVALGPADTIMLRPS